MSTSSKFSSTPNGALARFFGALLTTLFLFAGVAFCVWAVTIFGSPWPILVLLGLPLAACGVIFAKGTWDNWFDWRRVKMLAEHNGSIEDLLASELNAFNVATGKSGRIVFAALLPWLDQRKSSLDTSNTLDALIMLEEAGQIRREYPEGGGLIIHLLPAFNRRPVFALAPQRHD